MQATPPQLSDAWHNALLPFFEAEPWFDIQARLDHSKQPTYPAMADIFAAFRGAAPNQVKAVIVGQDPYHAPGQAMGLAFSVPQGQRIPPSLRNIHKELHADLQLPLPTHGDLTAWSRQGVLLLNTTLTVEVTPTGLGRHSLNRFSLPCQRIHIVFTCCGESMHNTSCPRLTLTTTWLSAAPIPPL